jgi:hypothetical protein
MYRYGSNSSSDMHSSIATASWFVHQSAVKSEVSVLSTFDSPYGNGLVSTSIDGSVRPRVSYMLSHISAWRSLRW